MDAVKLIQGAWDLHVHAAPDLVPRSVDGPALARAGREAGMGGFLLKDHTSDTAGRCQALNALVEGGPVFVGALALNPPVGGLNPTAVESALRKGTRVVYMPTYGAAYHIGIWGRGKPPTAFPLPADAPGERLLDQAGGLRPELDPILGLIAAHDAVLCTGHISPAESLAVLQAAKAKGIKRLMVTHASEAVTVMPVEMQKEAVALGALIEHSLFAVTQACPGTIPLTTIVEQVRAVGAEHCVLSSDFGQGANPPPVAGLTFYLDQLLKLGMTPEELRVMVADNPRRLVEAAA